VQKLRPIIGLVVVILVIVGLAYGRTLLKPQTSTTTTPKIEPVPGLTPVTVTGLWGSDKDVLLSDPDIKRILSEKYRVTVAGKVQSQFNLKPVDVEDKDFVWHSSRVSVDEFKEKKYPVKKEAVILRTPLVIYAWAPITGALLKSGIVAKTGETYYITDLTRLTLLMMDQKPWKEIGLGFYGPINVYSTDPKLTNSGMLYYALLATVLNKGQLLNITSIEGVLPRLKGFYGAQGAMDSKNLWLLESFLQKGAGENPMIVTWESELQEFVLSRPNDADFVKKNIQVLYPRPTIWSDHIFLATTDNGKRLLEALQDPEVQRLSWEKHGFRTGLAGTQNDPKYVRTLGIPANIEQTIPTPRPEVMKRIKEGL
jgi:hypothetical protein